MKLTFKQTEAQPGQCFSAKRHTLPCLEQDWHFHTEFELIYFLKSTGTRYVDNSVGRFRPGELYLIGSNIPHLFRNDKEYYERREENKFVDLIVVKFEKSFLGERFFSLAETQNATLLLDRARRGIQFSPKDTALVHNHLVDLIESRGLAKIAGLLGILDVLSMSQSFSSLCDEKVIKFKTSEKARMAEIIDYLHINFHKKIALKEIASVAGMTPNSFCRFFKNRTQKSFSKYLNEIRIRHACKLLIEGEKQISDICYQSGYNTFTNFNRQFKNLMHVTPSRYIEKYKLVEQTDLG